MKELYGISNATNVLKQEFYKYFVVTEASENEDHCIKLQMKGDIDKVITEMVNLYNGIEKLPRMDPLDVEETLRPGAARGYPPKVKYIPPRGPTFNNDFDIPANHNMSQRHVQAEDNPAIISGAKRKSSSCTRSGSGVSFNLN